MRLDNLNFLESGSQIKNSNNKLLEGSIMKKLFTIIIVLALTGMNNKVVTQTTYINEDFESYAVGSFPSSGGWILLHNGAGTTYQVVTNVKHHNGTKCMTLTGMPGWAAHMYKTITQSPVIYAELSMLASANNTGSVEDMGRFQFYDLYNSNEFPGVYFYSTSNTIKCHIGNTTSNLISFNPDQWYKFKMKFDFNNHYIDVWINDSLVVSNLQGTLFSGSYDCFMLGAEHGYTTFYFDDIKVTDIPSGETENPTKKMEMSIYPNPVSDKITIVTPDIAAKKYFISISNLQGEEVFNEYMYLSTSKSINVSHLNNGIYVLSLRNEQENHMNKIVIRK
jgi:hypothetical protein